MKNILNYALVITLAVTGLFTACDEAATDTTTGDITACFNYAPSDEVVAGVEITFTNCSENATNYTWDFGDGNISADENPVHAFETAGGYQVQLIVANETTADTVSKLINVETGSGSGNVINLGNQPHEVDSVYLYEFERCENIGRGSYGIVFTNAPMETDFEDLEDQDADYWALEMYIMSDNENELSAGTYNFMEYTENWPADWADFTFISAYFSEFNNEDNDPGNAVAGTVTVDKSEETYTITLDITLEDNTISGTYTGPINYYTWEDDGEDYIDEEDLIGLWRYVYTDENNTEWPYELNFLEDYTVTFFTSESGNTYDIGTWSLEDNEVTITSTDGNDSSTGTIVDNTLTITVGTLENASYTKVNENDTENQVSDYDGNVYETVEIGDQIWMAENLKTTHYADGTPLVDGTGVDIEGDYTSTYYFWGNEDISNKETYGALYSWAAAMNGAESSELVPSTIQGVCPDGWHLPSDAEWTQLTDYLGGTEIAGGKMKATGTNYWWSPNEGATNESGFSGLPGGNRGPGGSMDEALGENGKFWSTTETEPGRAMNRRLMYENAEVDEDSDPMDNGLSVRCVKN